MGETSNSEVRLDSEYFDNGVLENDRNELRPFKNEPYIKMWKRTNQDTLKLE